jgi:hypothetical protein
VVAFYAVNGCYPDQTSSQTSPFAGAMPTGLGPYVGGPWPTTQLYGTFDQNWNWVGSGTTASIILPRHRLRSANETPAESPVSAGTA